MTDHNKVPEFYKSEDLAGRILSALAASGKDMNALTVRDLAPVDAFHIRGRRATEELAQRADIRAGHRVLDVGCGLGGTSRYLADTFGCRVTGVDVTDEFCSVAGMLSARVGLSDRTVYRVCDATALPFSAKQFDIVWTEHVQMNVAGKTGFYGEMCRVLKPGGLFVFHDLFAGPAGELIYPLPWAGDPSINHLAPFEKIETLLIGMGFESLYQEDTTGVSAEFFRSVLKHIRTHGWRPAGLHLVMGDNTEDKFNNLLRNLEEERVQVVQAVMKRG